MKRGQGRKEEGGRLGNPDKNWSGRTGQTALLCNESCLMGLVKSISLSTTWKGACQKPRCYLERGVGRLTANAGVGFITIAGGVIRLTHLGPYIRDDSDEIGTRGPPHMHDALRGITGRGGQACQTSATRQKAVTGPISMIIECCVVPGPANRPLPQRPRRCDEIAGAPGDHRPGGDKIDSSASSNSSGVGVPSLTKSEFSINYADCHLVDNKVNRVSRGLYSWLQTPVLYVLCLGIHSKIG